MKHTAVQRIIKIQADAQGRPTIPDRIHLMSTGHWHTPYHGAFEMSADDLAAMAENFNAGIGLVEGSKRAPINYGHDIGGKAAGWISRLVVEGDELWGEIEWTPKGRQALEDGEYRYISPEWNPRDFPWENPQVEGEFVDNVFNGAALTNIPLFTKLKPVMASRDAGDGGSDNNNPDTGGDMLVLDEVRVKTPEELTDEEKAFLEEHKADLTDEERTTFGLDAETPEAPESPETPETPEEPEQPEEPTPPKTPHEAAPNIEASAQPVQITADRLKQLEAAETRVRQLEAAAAKKEAQGIMADAHSAGKVKSDQVEAGVKLLLATSGESRKQLEAFISALPANTMITAGEQGSGKDEPGVVLTDEERDYATAMNLTEAEVIEYKKSKESKE